MRETENLVDVNRLKEAINRQLEEVIRVKKTRDSNQKHEGQVVRFSDGVARVMGITDARIGQRVVFESETTDAHGRPGRIDGLVMDIEPQWTECVVFGEERFIKEGQRVVIEEQDRERSFSVPFRESFIGHVIDPLCTVQRIADENDDVVDESIPVHRLSIEVPAPIISVRAEVKKPLLTGIRVVDSTLPIGLGQRMLIIGDRGTGKTALATTMMINHGKDGGCKLEAETHGKKKLFIYTAIGKKISEVKAVYEKLKDSDVDFIVVSTKANDPAALVYIAPFAATSIAEYFRDRGRDVVVVYDDLTNHANAYRHVSLLLKRPPGREAYPGDIFYLHSRLLERASNIHLKKTAGGFAAATIQEVSSGGKDNKDFTTASITAFPIVQTKESDFSAYIPTNIISITDGQIYLDPSLMNKDIFPAVSVGLSVSRIGGNAQGPVMKAITKDIKGDLAVYSEKMKYQSFGLELDTQGKAAVAHGERLVDFFKQPLFNTSSESRTVAGISLIYIAKKFLDKLLSQKSEDVKGTSPGEVALEREIVEKLLKATTINAVRTIFFGSTADSTRFTTVFTEFMTAFKLGMLKPEPDKKKEYADFQEDLKKNKLIKIAGDFYVTVAFCEQFFGKDHKMDSSMTLERLGTRFIKAIGEMSNA